eukprot:13581904-Alexandrium_andersonii.AAC.1
MHRRIFPGGEPAPHLAELEGGPPPVDLRRDGQHPKVLGVGRPGELGEIDGPCQGQGMRPRRSLLQHLIELVDPPSCCARHPSQVGGPPTIRSWGGLADAP